MDSARSATARTRCHEHVDIAALPERAALVAGLIASDRIEAMSNILKTTLLLGAMSALFLFIGEVLGGGQGLMVGFFFAVAMNFASYWFSDKIVLRMYRATGGRSGHRLYEMVDSPGAARRSAAAPRLHRFPTRRRTRLRPAAIRSTRRSPPPKGSCGFSTTRSSRACIAHELAHVKHRDILISSVAATLAAAIMMVSRFAMFFGGSRDDDRERRTPSRCSRR